VRTKTRGFPTERKIPENRGALLDKGRDLSQGKSLRVANTAQFHKLPECMLQLFCHPAWKVASGKQRRRRV